MNKRQQIAVLFGGRSVEHEISIVTAIQAMEALDTRRYNLLPVYVAPSGCWYHGECLLDRKVYRSFAKTLSQGLLREVTILPRPGLGGLYELATAGRIPVDVALLAFHGQYGEDGCIQGLLELAGIPYTGCGPLASALVMHKSHCKAVLKTYGVPVLPDRVLSRGVVQRDFKRSVAKIARDGELGGFPLFVKPLHLGSSVGVSSAYDERQLADAIATVLVHDSHAMIEPCIERLLEINVSCCGGDVSLVEVPVASDSTLSYEDKYLRGGDKFGGGEGMASLSRVIDPSDLDREIKDRVVEIAKTSYQVLEADGVVRFDFLVDLAQDKLYFNEVNAIPGSLAYYLWEPRLLYTQLLDTLITQAMDKRREGCRVERNFGLHVLRSSSGINSFS